MKKFRVWVLPSLPRPSLDESACTYMHASSAGCLTPSSSRSIEVEAVVHGYRVYKEIWTPSIDEELICARELAILLPLPYALAHACGPGAQILAEFISRTIRNSRN